MEKRIQRKIVGCLISITLIACIIFGSLLWLWGKRSVYREMEQILEQEERFYQLSMEQRVEMVSDYVSGYMLKLYSMDALLQEQPALRSIHGFQTLCDGMGISGMYLFDDDGVIAVSNNEKAVGTELCDVEAAAPFAEMIRQGGDMIVNFSCEDIVVGGEGQNFLALPASAEGYSMLLMGIDRAYAEKLMDETAMEELMIHIPTTNDNALIALDRETKTVLGEASEHSELLNGKNLCEEEGIFEKLEDAEKGKILRIDGVPVLAKTKVVDNVIFVDLRLTDALTQRISRMFVGIALLLTVVAGSLGVTIRRSLKTYVFDEVAEIQGTVRQIIDGDSDVTFQSRNDEEFREIVALLNEWNTDARYLNQKLNWVVGTEESDMAVFETRSCRKGIFASENMQRLLGLEDEEWRRMREDAELFHEYISSLMTKGSGSSITETNGKYLLIRLHMMEQNYFGTVKDCTEEICKNTELQKAAGEAVTDPMTKLVNRRGFERSVTRMLDAGEVPAVILMMDIDHFKQVNDTLGHPAGDEVLRETAAYLQTSFRDEDVVARLGGDEFAVLFGKGISKSTVEEKLRRLQDGLRQQMQPYESVRLSVSIGAVYLKTADLTYAKLYQMTDDVLYEAKRSGKDQFRIREYGGEV